MRIDSLRLKNFRNIEDQTFHFNPHFTVVIGVNGKGKSTLLHGLRVAMGAFFLGIPEVRKRHIGKDEIRRSSETNFVLGNRPVIVEAKGVLNNDAKSESWTRQILAEKSYTTSDVGSIKAIGKAKYNKMVNEKTDDLDLPVLAYFGINRFTGTGQKRNAYFQREIFKEGYNAWDEMRANVYRYGNWLEAYPEMLPLDGSRKKAANSFFFAILQAFPNIKQYTFRAGEIWLQVDMDDYTSEYLPLSLHSDGIRSYIEMVAELAFRCMILNGSKGDDAIIDTTGIVLIDEIDLFLHPSWQRHVVNDLKKAFPKIQFVATTHSPFIVQSLKADELINLDMLTDVDPSRLTVEEVSTQVMGVDDIFASDNVKQHKKSVNYLKVLEKEAINANDLAQLDEIENTISDPATRALLQMQRLKLGK